jgi:hypothetical protein
MLLFAAWFFGGGPTTVEAPDEATALSQAEAAYRRMHPTAAELTLTVENTFDADA